MTMAIPLGQRSAFYGEPLLLSQEEVAHRLGIGRTTIWRLVKAGELERVRIGSRTLITTRSIDTYLTRHSSTAEVD